MRLLLFLALTGLLALVAADDDSSVDSTPEDDETTTLTLTSTITTSSTTFESLVTASSNTIPASCRVCSITASEKVAEYTWTTESSFKSFLHTATFTYTALTIIDTVLDTTSYTVIVPDDVLASGFVPPTDTNERGTRTAVTSFTHTGDIITTTLAYPTAIRNFPDQVTVTGPINTVDADGERTCPDGQAIIEVERNPAAAPNCEHDLLLGLDCVEVDPLGWAYGLGVKGKDAAPLIGLVELNASASVIVHACDLATVLPAAVFFQSSWLLVGKASTSFAEPGKADAKPTTTKDRKPPAKPSPPPSPPSPAVTGKPDSDPPAPAPAPNSPPRPTPLPAQSPDENNGNTAPVNDGSPFIDDTPPSNDVPPAKDSPAEDSGSADFADSGDSGDSGNAAPNGADGSSPRPTTPGTDTGESQDSNGEEGGESSGGDRPDDDVGSTRDSTLATRPLATSTKDAGGLTQTPAVTVSAGVPGASLSALGLGLVATMIFAMI